MGGQKFLLFENSQESLKLVPIGTKRKITVAGIKVCLVQTRASLVAFLDACPHMSESLSSGHLNGQGEIICPWHSYRFSLKTGEETENRCGSLTLLTITKRGDSLYLEL